MADVSNAILKIENHPLEATYMTDGTNHRDYSEIKSDIQNGLVKTSSDTTQNITGSITISGDLTVQGTQHITKTENLGVKNAMIYTNEDGTTLSVNGGIGIKKDSTNVYGIVYNPTDDAVELGLGTTTTDGTFTFNSGEGNPVAIRADSSSLFDGNLIAWDGTTLKLVDGGARPDTSKFVTTDTEQTISGTKKFAVTPYLANGINLEDQNSTGYVSKIYSDLGLIWTEFSIDGGDLTYRSLLNSATQINGKALANNGNTTLYGSDITLASDNAGTLTDAIISANARIDKYKQSAIVDLGTQTTITDEQLATITADDYSGVVKWNTRYYSLQQISGASRIYTSNYLSSNYRITINTSTKAITNGSLSSLTSISSYVKDNLTYSTSGTTYALSAYQGYLLNNKISGKQDTLSDAQIAAANSGITSTKVSTYDGYATTIAGKQAMITDSNKLDASLVSGLATVATTGSYNDLSDQPDIPAAITNYVTTDTSQTISGTKIFGSKLWLTTEDSTPLDITFQYACSMVKFPVTVTLKPQTVSDDAGSYTLTLPAKNGTLATTSDITDTGATSIITSGSGNAVTTASYDSSTRKITLTKDNTFLTSAKSLNTNNAEGLDVSSEETLSGTGTIKLHKIAKTGSYNDLLNKPTIPSTTNFVTIADTQTISGAKTFSSQTIMNGDLSIDPNDTDGVSILIKGSAGTSGQVLMSCGEGVTPMWSTISSPTFSYSNNVLTITY